MDPVRIEKVGSEDAERVCRFVDALLKELGEEGDETGALDAAALTDGWRRAEDRHCAFLAFDDDGAVVGLLTLSTAFALYAGGDYGIINEMYVLPAGRGRGVGALLLEAVREHGREMGWRRIDVTAPESDRWVRTREFYERAGYAFTGPKLKILLD